MSLEAKDGHLRLTLGCKPTRLLGFCCKELTGERLSMFEKDVASFKSCILDRVFKQSNSAVLLFIVVQQSRFEGYRLKTLLSRNICTKMNLTWRVGFKA